MTQQGKPTQIDRDYVRLLMAMRRFVRDEFETTIAISETEATIKLLDYAERSRNAVLQEMGKELHSMLKPEATIKQQAQTSQKVHYYRGAAQVVTGDTQAAATRSADTAPGKQRIYRGRVVVG